MSLDPKNFEPDRYSRRWGGVSVYHCRASIPTGDQDLERQCPKEATRSTREGGPLEWCGRHDPNAVIARKEAAARNSAKRAEIARLKDEVIAAAREYRSGGNENLFRDALDRLDAAEGEETPF